jgi:hypothetical protein
VSRSLLTPFAAAPTLLTLIGLVVALVFAVKRRDRLGRAGLFAIVGISMMIANTLLSVLVSFIAYARIFRQASYQGYMTLLVAENLISTVLWCTGLGLVIAAVFIGRGGPAGPQPQPDPYAPRPPDPPLY